MRFKRKYVVGVILFLCAWGAQGQEFQKKVVYETSTYKTFAVACDVEVDSLSPLDLFYLEAKPALKRLSEFVIMDEWLTITHTYPQQPYYDECYGFQMGKSVTNVAGTTLYDHAGNAYDHLPNNVDGNFMIDIEEITSYGVFNSLFDNPAETINQMITLITDVRDSCKHASNVSFDDWGSKIFITYEEYPEYGYCLMEIEMDFDDLYIETRTFLDGIHEFTNRTEYKKIEGDWIIPKREKRIYYSELPSETRYQITETTVYLSYIIMGRDIENNIVYINSSLGVEIIPNPVDEDLILHFSMPMGEMVEIRIMDITNATVWEGYDYVSGDVWSKNIDDWEPGMYTVLCISEKGTAYANFLKNGIDLYDILNPTNMNIYVYPNPTQDYIRVCFSMPIDDNIMVKIMDAMNNVYIDNSMYVFGNILHIYDVSSLPTGIYYIICRRSEGTGIAKFIKL